jgi:hypothetical protein
LQAAVVEASRQTIDREARPPTPLASDIDTSRKFETTC